MKTGARGVMQALEATTAGRAGSPDFIRAGKTNAQLWQCLHPRPELIKTDPRERQLTAEWLFLK